MTDCLIIGGGIVGLSLAYELAGKGLSVHVLERGQPGQEASWAGAGLLPPANQHTATDPYDQLAGISHHLHSQWAAELRDATGIDTGYRKTGSIHIARDTDSEALLRAAAELWRRRQIVAEEILPDDLGKFEPQLGNPGLASLRAAFLLPDEAQLRNPRHLKALIVACARRGVVIELASEVTHLDRSSGRINAVVTTSGRRTAKTYCICGGAWSGGLAQQLGVVLAMSPVRGQIVLLAHQFPLLHRILNEGRRYLVPRPDGRLLIGSTEEDAGFDKRTTADGIGGLLRFAVELVGGLGGATVERCWAGLRPGTPDGLPYLGRLGDLENAFVATGHLRGGIHLSTGTALVMGRLICNQPPGIDLSPFHPDRFARMSECSPFTA